MSGYHIHEGMFELDDSWTDQSMNILSRPLAGGKQASLVVNREPREGANLDAHVDAIVRKLKAQLPRFALKERGAIEVAELPGMLVSCTWRQSGIDLVQYLAFFEMDITFPGPAHRVMTFTMTAPISAESSAKSELRAIIDSVRLRRV